MQPSRAASSGVQPWGGFLWLWRCFSGEWHSPILWLFRPRPPRAELGSPRLAEGELPDHDSAIRVACVMAPKWCGAPRQARPWQASPGRTALPLFGPPNIDRLAAKGDIPGLIKALEHPRLWRVRRDAAQALGEARESDAVQPLSSALIDDNTSVRIAAIEALGKIGDPDGVEPLIGSLRSQAVEIRKAAADALGQIGDPRALEPLIGSLSDTGWSVRRAAARALGAIGDARAAEPLKAASQDSDINVRNAVAEALAALGWRPKGTVGEAGQSTRVVGGE